MTYPHRRTALTYAALALAACWAGIPAHAADASELVYVGTQASQIRALRFDAATGQLTPIGTVAEGLRPTWTVAHPQLPVLYAVNDDSSNDGSVTAFAINQASGALSKLNELPSGGKGATFLSLDAPSGTLLAANFGSGSVSSLSLNADGSLAALVSTVKAKGSGPHRRQASAHAHAAVADPSRNYVLVPDLGADRVFIHRFDRVTHTLTAAGAYVSLPGSGPRHLAFGANGQYAYLLNELIAEIVVLRWDAQQGKLTFMQSFPTSTAEFKGGKSGSEIAVSPDGRFVYVGNRGENAIVAYRIDPANGLLSLVQRVPAGGEVPWGFAIHPSGRWLLVANQRGGKINVFSIDTVSGKLADTGVAVEAPAPVSVTFAK